MSGVAKKREINLGDEFGEVAVMVNGRRVEVRADGSIAVDAKGPVTFEPAANDRARTKERAPPQVGDTMPDGTKYAGISPTTGQPMYTTPADAPLTYTFNKAKDYAAALDAHGHKDWRVPTKSELNVLFQNRTALGGFDTSGSYPTSWYRSSSLYDFRGWVQYFGDGTQYYKSHVVGSSLRCVR